MNDKPNYYGSTRMKVSDFLLGLFVPVLLLLTAAAGDSLLSNTDAWTRNVVANTLLVGGGLAFLAGVVYSFRVGRRYFAIGMLSIIVVPALIAGTCAVFVEGALR